MELTIVNLLMNSREGDDHKIVYLAPTKALCTERFLDWKEKFTPLGVRCAEITGDTDHSEQQSLSHVDLMHVFSILFSFSCSFFFDFHPLFNRVTTPEKWDSLTRRWKDYQYLMNKIKLVIIDEVHILNESRGPVVEVIVSRMKTMETKLQEKESRQFKSVRFVAVSATVPNLSDISVWLGSKGIAADLCSFGEEYRPVKLKKVVLSFPKSSANTFAFDHSLNYK